MINNNSGKENKSFLYNVKDILNIKPQITNNNIFVNASSIILQGFAFGIGTSVGKELATPYLENNISYKNNCKLKLLNLNDCMKENVNNENKCEKYLKLYQECEKKIL
jgi:hypothetical protein